MNRALRISILILCWISHSSAISAHAASDEDVKVSSFPLTSEQLEVYRVFLAEYLKGSKRELNLANVTVVFHPDEGDSSGCMHGFPDSRATVEVHVFDDSFARANHVRVVNPKTHKTKDPEDSMGAGAPVDAAVDEGLDNGLFTLSEVIFDSKHNRAALRYEFYCGRLCGQSATVVLEKHKGAWRRSKAFCGYSIS
jgi:hypothetical protein